MLMLHYNKEGEKDAGKPDYLLLLLQSCLWCEAITSTHTSARPNGQTAKLPTNHREKAREKEHLKEIQMRKGSTKKQHTLVHTEH